MAVAGVHRDFYLAQPLQQPAAVGALLALAILFRRHFAFAVLIFFFVADLQAVVRFAARRWMDDGHAWSVLRFTCAPSSQGGYPVCRTG